MGDVEEESLACAWWLVAGEGAIEGVWVSDINILQDVNHDSFLRWGSSSGVFHSNSLFYCDHLHVTYAR